MSKFTDKILAIKPVAKSIALSRKLIIPGFEGIPLYDVLVFFINGLQNGAITIRAASLAFNFFLALFPSIIFLFTLIPYIPIEGFQIELFEILHNMMPKSAFEAAEETIADIIQNQHGGLLSIGFFSALIFSTNGFNAMIEAFNSSSHSVGSRSMIKQRLIAFLLVIITTVLLITAIALIIFSEFVLSRFVMSGVSYYAIVVGRFIILFGLFFSIISFFYYIGPARSHKWKFISAGSTFATLVSLLLSWGFGYYVNNFAKYNKLYGSIGTLIVVLLWLYFNSIVLLLGFELNASIKSAKNNPSNT